MSKKAKNKGGSKTPKTQSQRAAEKAIADLKAASGVPASRVDSAGKAQDLPPLPGPFHICQTFCCHSHAKEVGESLERLSFTDPNVKALRDVLLGLLGCSKATDGPENYAKPKEDEE